MPRDALRPRRWRKAPFPGIGLFVLGSLITQIVNYFFLLSGEQQQNSHPLHPSPLQSLASFKRFRIHDANQHRAMQKNTSNTAIFYNVFVPPLEDGIGPSNALRIIQEQLQQLRNSYVKNAPVYYTLIGYNETRHVFDGPNFHLLQYVEKGSEELTLQALWGYCLQHPTHRVSYIHDKGSFHPGIGNEVRRAYATKSALSEACHTMPHDKCNVCVFDFYLTPYHHGGANMWTADCHYVKKLLPPKEFETHMKRMYASIPPESPLKPQDFGDNALCLGRYALEHWVLSHPHVRPCETLGKSLSYAKVRKLGSYNWKPQLGRKIHNVRFYGIFKSPWFTIEGRLYQYEYLYGEKPPVGSWFWPIYRNKVIANHNTTMTEDHDDQRVVILSGPVKSILNTLVSLKKDEELEHWTLVGKNSLQPSVKAILANNDDTIPIRNTSTFSKIQHAWNNGNNILLGAEPLLDYLVMSSYQGVVRLFPQNVIVDVNIMYQTPRSSHLISVYQDAMAITWTFPLKQTSPWEWLCHGDHVEKIVTAQLNPMGVANTFIRHGNATVTIGDESGMVDVLGTVACEVLHVSPCNDTEWINNYSTAAGARAPPPEMKNKHLVEMETILRRMDCFYYCRMRGKLTILHEKDVMFSETEGWNECCAASPKEASLSPSAAYEALRNLGCRASNEKKAAEEVIAQLKPSKKATSHVKKVDPQVSKDIPTKEIMSQVNAAKKSTSQVKKVKAAATKDIPAKEVISQVKPTKKATSRVKKVKQDPPLGVLVLGMHRSGTSLLAGLLVEGFGYTVGGPLLRASGENSKGYYEKRDVVLENMHLLEQQGAHWNKAVEKYNASIPLVLGDKGKKALRFMEDLGNAPWLLKDPRFCITLPTWHIQPAIVFTYRHPMQVASSLEERFLTLERGLELWIIYNKRAIENSQQLCRVLSSNDAILANPLDESIRIVEELVQKCHLQRPPRNATREIVDQFVDVSLQSHTQDDACQEYDSSEKGEMYKKAMKVYCDLQSGKAYKPDYEWPI